MDLLAISILAAAALIGLCLIPLGLPGLWVMVAGILAYGWLTGFRSVGVATIAIVLGLAFLGEIMDQWLGFYYAKRYGGSTRSGWGALIGGIIGAMIGVPIAIIGSVIGAFLGSFAGAALLVAAAPQASPSQAPAGPPPVPTNHWTADPPHSAVAFRVRHLGITWVNGTFGQWTADLNYDPAKPEAATVTAHIQAATISTGNDRRDNDLRTPRTASPRSRSRAHASSAPHPIICASPAISQSAASRVRSSSKPMSAACSRPRAAAAPRFPLLPTSSGRITAFH